MKNQLAVNMKATWKLKNMDLSNDRCTKKPHLFSQYIH